MRKDFKKMKKKITALLLALLMLLSMTACGGKEDPAPEKEDPLMKGTHSNSLAWRIPWTA